MPKILLIDDSKTIHKVAGLILKGTPYHLITADEAEKGFQLACQERPEVILVDYTISGTNGLDLMKRLSVFPDLRRSRIALLHGHFQKVDEGTLRKVRK